MRDEILQQCRQLYRMPWKLLRPRREKELQNFWARYQWTPAPLDECLAMDRKLRRVFDHPNPLSPPQVIRKGQEIADPELAARLKDEDFGGWSPQIEQIDWLVDTLKREPPTRILEFGGGRSTVCFCMILQRLLGPEGFRVLSIDQDPENVERATNRLAGLPGAASCRVVHAPLLPATIEGRRTVTYDLDTVDPAHFAWLGKATFVFVDGPFGEGPCRYGTLPKIRHQVAPRARFIMDDALREKELLAGRLWASENFQVEGVLTLGQGMMVGMIP